MIFLSGKKEILLVSTLKGKKRKFILYLKHRDDRGWEHSLFLPADGDSYLRIFDLQWESCFLQMVTWTLHPVLTAAWVSWQIDKNLVGPRSEYMVEGKIHLLQAFPQPTEKSLTQISCNESIKPQNMELIQVNFPSLWIWASQHCKLITTFKKRWSYHMNCSPQIHTSQSQNPTKPKQRTDLFPKRK